MNVFKVGTTVIGTLFAAGSGFGLVLVLVTQAVFSKFKRFSYTLEICISMSLIGCAALLATVPVFEVYFIAIVLLAGFNDVATICMIYLNGFITSNNAYQKIGPLS